MVTTSAFVRGAHPLVPVASWGMRMAVFLRRYTSSDRSATSSLSSPFCRLSNALPHAEWRPEPSHEVNLSLPASMNYFGPRVVGVGLDPTSRRHRSLTVTSRRKPSRTIQDLLFGLGETYVGQPPSLCGRKTWSARFVPRRPLLCCTSNWDTSAPFCG